MAHSMQKPDLANLYINPDYYNTDYNFYNYHKFKQTGTINIIYKTPSIFLNGLYFELPYCRILNISKPAGSTSFVLSLLINKNDVLDHSQNKLTIGQLLTNIDAYNNQFFSTHAKKLEIRQSQTNKNSRHYSGTRQAYESPVLVENRHNRFNNPVPSSPNYSYKVVASNPRQDTPTPFCSASDSRTGSLLDGEAREKGRLGGREFHGTPVPLAWDYNPMPTVYIKKYTYQPFISDSINLDKPKQLGNVHNSSSPVDNSANSIILNVEIKHIYMYKICELIKANQLLTDTVDDKLAGFCNTALDFVNQEFFDFRANTLELKLDQAQDNIDLNIKFWIKANSFEKTRSSLIMLWKVCGYQI